MPHPRAALGLAALLVLAGCAGSGGAVPAPVSVTPAPVPTDPSPTPAFRIAPGLSERGVVGPLTLATAHAERLRSSVYRVWIAERVVRGDGSVRWRAFEGTFANRTSYAFTVREGAGNRTVIVSSYYADGDRLYQRLVTDAGTNYYVPRSGLGTSPDFPEDPIGSPTQFDELYVALSGTRPAYVGAVERNGTPYHRIASAGAVNEDFLAAWEYVDSVEGYRFEALVAADGVVREYRIEYTATVGERRRQVTRTAQWKAVGEASVAPPDWYARARVEAGR